MKMESVVRLQLRSALYLMAIMSGSFNFGLSQHGLSGAQVGFVSQLEKYVHASHAY